MGTTTVVGGMTRADSHSSLSSMESYTLPKAATRKTTTKSFERMEVSLQDEVEDQDVDLVVTTVAGEQ